MAFAKHRLTRSSALLKKDGEMVKTPEDVKQQLLEHFSKILNIHSQFPQESLDSMP